MKKSDQRGSRRWRSLPTTASRAAPVWQSGTAQATTREGYVGIRHRPFQSRHIRKHTELAGEPLPAFPGVSGRREATPPNDGPTCGAVLPELHGTRPGSRHTRGGHGSHRRAAVANRPVASKVRFFVRFLHRNPMIWMKEQKSSGRSR